MSKMLRLKQVLEIIPVQKSTIYQWVKDGKFPPPIKLSSRCSIWDSQDIDKFLESAAQ
ncbi:MAG: AlpA family phage regulatory protein [Desulfuromonadales bacterium]